MTPIDFPPHVTIAHPRTCHNGTACYAELRRHDLQTETLVREILFTETIAASFTVLRCFPLAGLTSSALPQDPCTRRDCTPP